MKFIGCLVVFWGHFYSSFYGQLLDRSFLTGADNALDYITHHVFNVIFNGDWWVFVFCIISGRIAWMKEINSFFDLARALIHRYLRFVIPVLCANFFVIVISKTIGFHSSEVGNSINNMWLAGNYSRPLQISRVLISALLLNNEFVGPLWVLLYIFVGTSVLYCFKFLIRLLKLDERNASLLLLVVVWPVFYWALLNYESSWFYSLVTIAGAMMNITKHTEEKTRSIISALGLLCIVICLNIWVFNKTWNFITAWLFIWLTCHCVPFVSFLETNKSLGRVSHLSFTIYLLHCPILYSVSMLLFQWINGAGVPYSITAIINFVFSTVIVIILSELYYRLIQKRLDIIVTRILQ